jgi:predicted phosphate transport protein (TIGR00153 family)
MKFFKPERLEFFDLFKEVGENISAISALFARFTKEFNHFEKYAKEAKEIEHLADDKTHQIVALLNSTFITPFDREDIYLLAHELDDIVDLIEKSIHSIFIYKVAKKNPAFDEFASLISECAEYNKKLIACLEKQKCSAELSSAKIAIHELEDRGDEVFAAAITKLFSEEKDQITVIKEKDILECLENIIDKYQKVSDIIEGILVKSS